MSVTDVALATARLLSSETRLRLLRLLRVRPGGKALCVNALARRLGVTQAAVSQHLRQFDELGLVQCRAVGVRNHYWLDEDALERCLSAMRVALAPSDEDEDARLERGGAAEMDRCSLPRQSESLGVRTHGARSRSAPSEDCAPRPL